MAEFSEKAQDFIRNHGMQDILGKGLFSLSTLQSYTLLSNEFPPKTRREIFQTLRKVFFINCILEWKIFALVGERKMIQAEFIKLCDRWEFIENVIKAYNNGVVKNDAPNFSSISIIETAADGFAPLTKFKGGKVQLKNKHIQREFEKLRNRHKRRLTFHALIALTLENYIKENKIIDFINEDIIGYISELKSDLAHAPKYSTEILFANDSHEKSDAKIYAVYPNIKEGITKAKESDFKICYNFLFRDLEQIEQWQKDLWGI